MALVLAGLAGRAWLTRTALPSERFLLEELGPAGAPGPESGLVGLGQPGERRSLGPPTLALVGEEAALFGLACELQLMAEGEGLQLSGRQWTALAATVVHWETVRRNFEAEIAQVQEIGPGRHRLEIPAYPEAGDELRGRFQAELETALGPAAAMEVKTKLGSRLEARFAGFGVSAQTLEVVGDPIGAPGAVQVERVARFWNSVDGRERLSTRRELHLPAIEDPAGESWHALLALVVKAD